MYSEHLHKAEVEYIVVKVALRFHQSFLQTLQLSHFSGQAAAGFEARRGF